jgi:hypothetical protein
MKALSTSCTSSSCSPNGATARVKFEWLQQHMMGQRQATWQVVEYVGTEQGALLPYATLSLQRDAMNVW